VVSLTALTIASRTLGVDFARAMAKPLLLSSLVNCFVYTLVVRYCYERLGISLGTLAAFAAALVSAAGTVAFSRRNAGK
jgi:hypothetical protein